MFAPMLFLVLVIVRAMEERAHLRRLVDYLCPILNNVFQLGIFLVNFHCRMSSSSADVDYETSGFQVAPVEA